MSTNVWCILLGLTVLGFESYGQQLVDIETILQDKFVASIKDDRCKYAIEVPYQSDSYLYVTFRHRDIEEKYLYLYDGTYDNSILVAEFTDSDYQFFDAQGDIILLKEMSGNIVVHKYAVKTQSLDSLGLISIGTRSFEVFMTPLDQLIFTTTDNFNRDFSSSWYVFDLSESPELVKRTDLLFDRGYYYFVDVDSTMTYLNIDPDQDQISLISQNYLSGESVDTALVFENIGDIESNRYFCRILASSQLDRRLYLLITSEHLGDNALMAYLDLDTKAFVPIDEVEKNNRANSIDPKTQILFFQDHPIYNIDNQRFYSVNSESLQINEFSFGNSFSDRISRVLSDGNQLFISKLDGSLGWWEYFYFDGQTQEFIQLVDGYYAANGYHNRGTAMTSSADKYLFGFVDGFYNSGLLEVSKGLDEIRFVELERDSIYITDLNRLVDKIFVTHACNLSLLQNDPFTTHYQNFITERIDVFPNPTRDKLYWSGIPDQATVQIISSGGQLVWSGTQDQSSIDVERLPNGTYVLLISKENRSWLGQFVKSN